MHVFDCVENVANVKQFVETEIKMQDIRMTPSPAIARISHLTFVSAHFLLFDPIPFIPQGGLLPQVITPLQLHRTEQIGQKKPCCLDNPRQMGLSFGKSTHRNQFQQQLLQMAREQLSTQQQVLYQNQIGMLREQLRLQRQQIRLERVQQQQLQIYGRTMIISSQMKLLRKIQELRMVQVRSLQQQIAYQQNFLRTQAALQRHMLLHHLQYLQMQKLEEQLLKLQQYLAQNKASIQRTEAKRNHFLHLQRRLEVEIEQLKREQTNNTTHTLIKTKSGSFYQSNSSQL